MVPDVSATTEAWDSGVQTHPIGPQCAPAAGQPDLRAERREKGTALALGVLGCKSKLGAGWVSCEPSGCWIWHWKSTFLDQGLRTRHSVGLPPQEGPDEAGTGVPWSFSLEVTKRQSRHLEKVRSAQSSERQRCLGPEGLGQEAGRNGHPEPGKPWAEIIKWRVHSTDGYTEEKEQSG